MNSTEIKIAARDSIEITIDATWFQDRLQAALINQNQVEFTNLQIRYVLTELMAIIEQSNLERNKK